LARVADDVAGMELEVAVGGAPAAAKFAEEGGAAGCNVPDSTTFGSVWVDGSAGAADRASTDASSDPSGCFHHAHRGPDWQPARPTTVTRISAVRRALDFMIALPLG
jgi:hypothetical protein